MTISELMANTDKKKDWELLPSGENLSKHNLRNMPLNWHGMNILNVFVLLVLL